MAFNKVILVGNMVADPELKKTPSGVSLATFRIAVSRRVTKQGEQPVTDFIDIVTWRQTAEFVVRYFTKGKPILVCGQLQTRSWQDNNGQKRYATEVIADEVSFVGNSTVQKPQEAAQNSAGATQGEKQSQHPEESNARQEPSYASYGGQTSFEQIDDDDLPF